MDITTIPLLTLICYLFIEALKTTKLNTKWFPIISAAVGAILYALAFLVTPSITVVDSVGLAIVVGAASGLAATGAFEAYKHILKTDKTESTETKK